jgi:hypothetical protein
LITEQAHDIGCFGDRDRLRRARRPMPRSIVQTSPAQEIGDVTTMRRLKAGRIPTPEKNSPTDAGTEPLTASSKAACSAADCDLGWQASNRSSIADDMIHPYIATSLSVCRLRLR